MARSRRRGKDEKRPRTTTTSRTKRTTTNNWLGLPGRPELVGEAEQCRVGAQPDVEIVDDDRRSPGELVRAGAEIGIAVFAAGEPVADELRLDAAADGVAEPGVADGDHCRRAEYTAASGDYLRASRGHVVALPRGAAGRIDENAGRDQKAEAAAGAAVPSGTERKIVALQRERERRYARRERHTVEIGRLRAEVDRSFDAGDPAGRKLLVVACVQPELRGDAVERIGGGAAGEVDRRTGAERRRRGQVRTRRAEAGVETGIETGPRDRRRGGGGASFDEHRHGVAIRQRSGRAELVSDAQREQAVVQMDAVGRREGDLNQR